MTAERRARLRAQLGASNVDALLVTSLVNVRYLTGFTGSAGQLLVTADGTGDRFVTDGRYDAQSRDEVPDINRTILPAASWLSDALGERQRLGLEAHDIPWARVRELSGKLLGRSVVAAPRLVERLRQIKDADEVAALRRACAVADGAFAELMSDLKPGLTERDVAVRLERTMVDGGAQAPSFPSIVASGPNSAVPHHRPTDRPLAPGDLVKFDFGALVEGYHSDMTRMAAFGTPPANLLRVFEVVRHAQSVGVEAVSPGTQTADVDSACRDVVADAGWAEQFVHGTGHGLGLEIHEDPFLRPQQPQHKVGAADSVTLATGMTITVEPGVYLPGVGGVRIEDSLVVTPDGADVLTRTPKDLVVL